jgi:glycosyltransferase involved in cell wall biosynthesis
MEKIRILHCIESISFGGVERVRLSFAHNLNFERFDFKIICTRAIGPIKEEFYRLGIEIVEVGTFSYPFEWHKHAKVIAFVKNYKPHIIHGAVFEGMSMATIAGVIASVPLIFLEETSDPKFRSWKAIKLQYLYSLFARKVIGVSPSVVSYLKEKVKIPSRKCVLINNGIPIPPLGSKAAKNELKNSLGISPGDFVIGSVGRVYDAVKRFSDLLLILHRLQDPSIKFLLVGDGPDLSMLIELAEKKGIGNQFIAVGRQADPNPFYSIMTVFCLPSIQEGFGLVAVEAMFHFLPVVASNVGGLKSIIKDNQTGFLVNPGDIDHWIEKILFLKNSPDVRIEKGKNGYDHAFDNYRIEVYATALLELYEAEINLLNQT